jgi:hypothetical protein
VVVYDQFQDNVERAYREILDFLDVAIPPALPDFRSINQSRTWRNKYIRDIRAGRRLGIIRNVAGRILTTKTKTAVSHFVGKLNTKVQLRPPLSPELRVALTEEFAESVRELEALTGQDLEAWLPNGRAPG